MEETSMTYMDIEYFIKINKYINEHIWILHVVQ